MKTKSEKNENIIFNLDKKMETRLERLEENFKLLMNEKVCQKNMI